MKTISISRKKFNELNKIVLSREILNTEGPIFDFKFKNQEKVLKTLYTTSGERFANKLYTIEMLDSYKQYLPTSFVIPDYICSMNNNIIGFTLPKINGINLTTILNDRNGDYKEQIYYLKKIGELLIQLHNIRKYTPLKDIYIGDLHDSNFLVDSNNRELKVIDLDSSKIGNNKPFPARFLTQRSLATNSIKYNINPNKNDTMGYIIPNSDSDLYCYCIIILNYLYGEHIGSKSLGEFYNYLNYLEYVGMNKELIEVFSKLVIECDNKTPLPYLDSLNPEIICRSKKLVYDKVVKHN